MSNGVNEHLNVALQKETHLCTKNIWFVCSLRFNILNLKLFLNPINLQDILNAKLQVK